MNSYGNNIKITVFGQSHAESIGVVIDGLKSGIQIEEEYIARIMAKRAPGSSPLATKRKEADKVHFIAGVENGKTVGTSVCAVIYNSDMHSKDYSDLKFKPRPSHADYPAAVRFGENYDLRGGGQFSGRLTAPICIAGAIALSELEKSGICVSAHVYSIGGIQDEKFSLTDEEPELMQRLNGEAFAVIDVTKKEKMTVEIEKAAKELDSVGGVIECKITGVPAGIGEPMFCGVENAISSVIFAIPAVKGIEFGAGFESAKLRGSENNDSYFYDGDVIKTRTNNAGGICGGMATAMPIVFRCAIKPTPSIGQVQDTVDMKNKCNTKLQIHGRHDPCIAVRANTVVRCAAALAIYDLMQY